MSATSLDMDPVDRARRLERLATLRRLQTEREAPRPAITFACPNAKFKVSEEDLMAAPKIITEAEIMAWLLAAEHEDSKDGCATADSEDDCDQDEDDLLAEDSPEDEPEELSAVAPDRPVCNVPEGFPDMGAPAPVWAAWVVDKKGWPQKDRDNLVSGIAGLTPEMQANQVGHWKKSAHELAGIPLEDDMQMGFDLDWHDPKTNEPVPWMSFTDKDVIKALRDAPWKVVDTETTGLTPGSKVLNLEPKNLRHGADPAPRLRVVTAVFPDGQGGTKLVAFDMDKATPAQYRSVCEAALTGVFVAHNAGFDLYWLRTPSIRDKRQTARIAVMPKRVLDTMLIARITRPETLLRAAEICNDEDHPLRELAQQIFIQERGGWSLADLNLVHRGVEMSKEMQGPKNWSAPWLGPEHYKYATGDSIDTLELLRVLIDAEDGEDTLAAYERACVNHPHLLKLEAPVQALVEVREHGVPVSEEWAEAYAKRRFADAVKLASEMVAIEPTLASYLDTLANPNKGLSEKAKEALGTAFRNRGVPVRMTEKTGTDQVGEKELRLAGAENMDEAKPLFYAWSALSKAKKAANMALDMIGFAKRSPDGRVHPLLGFGPVTLRLSSAEPNSQNNPRDPDFRAIVTAKPDHLILANDYGALDMRAGAALAIRTQIEMREKFHAGTMAPDIAASLHEVIVDKNPDAAEKRATKEKKAAIKAIEVLEGKRGTMKSSAYYKEREKFQRMEQIAHLTLIYAEIYRRATAAGTTEWGALREAFRLGVDIHTFTAADMNGMDPVKLFNGLTGKELKTKLKEVKEALGPLRQGGKVANLGLLYAMKGKGFAEYAAKQFNIHWTLEEAEAIRDKWFKSLIEIDLWHTWTGLNPLAVMWVPNPDSPGKNTRAVIYDSVTLSGRRMIAFGLNAALSYQDQGSGADIMADVLDELKANHRPIFDMAINQVHDELVLEIPSAQAESVKDEVQQVMDACANVYLMKYGVPSESSPAMGSVWLKEPEEDYCRLPVYSRKATGLHRYATCMALADEAG